MTRQEAIEAAMLRLFGEYLPQRKEAMVALHEQGRIAGLREAARIVEESIGRPMTAYIIAAMAKAIKTQARELAKKARSK